MRGNFNLSTGISTWDYAEFEGNFNKRKSKEQKEILRVLLKFLGFNKKRKSFNYMRTQRGYGGAGTVVFFNSYMTKSYGSYGDYLGLCIQDYFQNDYTTITFGAGHIYEGSFEEYFSTTNSVEIKLDDEIIERLVKNELTDDDEKFLIEKFTELKNKIKNYFDKKGKRTLGRKFGVR